MDKNNAHTSDKLTSNKLVDAMLDLAEARPFGDISLAQIAETAQVSLSDTFAVARSKGTLIDAYIERVDRSMIDEDYRFTDEMSVRDRLFDLAMTRFEAMQPNRLAVASILKSDGLSRFSQFSRASKKTAALMLEMAGIASDGLTGQGRVAVLATTLARVGQEFLKDDSQDLSRTMRALDKALSNLEQWAVDLSELRKGGGFKASGGFNPFDFGRAAWSRATARGASSSDRRDDPSTESSTAEGPTTEGPATEGPTTEGSTGA